MLISAINLSKRKLPEDYCSAAESWQSLKSIKGFANAINIIDLGLLKYNQLPSLLIYKRDLALNNGKLELAIETQKIIIEQSQRKEFPYYDMGLIYKQVGNEEQSKYYFNLSRIAISTLPKHIQTNNAVSNLSLALDKI